MRRRFLALLLLTVVISLSSFASHAEYLETSTVPVDRDLSGSNGSDDVVFHTGPTYPWYRIYITNNSNVDYKVNITDGSGNNQGIRWISPNSSITITNDLAANGIRIVNVSSQDGSSLKGTIRIRTATSKSEL